MTDIIIGARKPRPRKSRRLFAAAIALVTIYVAVRWTVASWTTYPNPESSLPKGELTATLDAEAPELALGDAHLSRTQGGLEVLRASGEPAALGANAGRLLGARVDEPASEFAQAARRSAAGRRILGRLLGLPRGAWALRHIDDGIPGHQLVELSAFQRGARRSGARVGYESLVRAQAVFDIAPPHPDSDGADLRATTQALTIVAPMQSGGGERLVVGHSLSMPGLPISAGAPLVRLYHPDGVIAFAAIGDPATLGVLTGVNAEGLFVAAHPLLTVDENRANEAQPTPLLVRDILENARTVEQAVAIIEAAKPLGSAIYVIADPAARAAVVVERTPSRFGVLPGEAIRVVVDLLESSELADEPESERNRRLREDAGRAKRAAALIADRAPRSAADLAAILRDDDGEEPPGHRAHLADPSATHVVIVDPAAMVLWVCEGPGPFGRFVAFDLRHELRREGKRGAPPADIEIDAAGAASAGAINAARELVFASRSARRHSAELAKQLVGRALLLAPNLPEALALADELGIGLSRR